MLEKIYYIECSDQLRPSFLESLAERYELYLSNYSSESLILDVCESKPDLIILNIEPGSEQISLQILKKQQAKIELPFILYATSINDLNIRQFLEFGVYGVFSDNTSGEELLVNINIALNRFSEDKKNRKDKYFLNEAERLSNIGHWRFDIKSSLLEWSDETYRIFERDRSLGTLSYKEFNEAIHPEDFEEVHSAYLNSVKRREPYEIEHRIVVNNKVKYVVEKCETFYHNDEPILSVGTVQDITSRKNLELEFEKSKANFKEFFSSSPEKNSLIKPDHLFILKNKFISAKKLGYLDNEISNKDFYEIVKSKKAYSLLLKSVEKLNVGEAYEVGGDLVNKWVEDEFTRRQTQLEKLNVNLNRQIELKNERLNTEILERKRAQELNQVFFNVIEQSSDFVKIFDVNGLIEYVNPALCAFTLYDKTELLGKKWDIFKSEMYEESYYQSIWRSILNGKTFSDDFVGKKKNGEMYSVTQIILPIKNLSGDISQFASISRDITEKKKLDKKIIDVQEGERSRIARELHDSIGQSIAAIKLSVNRITQKHQLPEKDIANTTNMIQSLTTSIREVAYGLMPSVLKDYGLIIATRKMIYQIENSTDIKVRFSNHDDKMRFSEDIELSLYRILQESLNNALTNSKASEIKISLVCSTSHICLKVIDNGVGFQYNDKVKIAGQGIRNMKYRTNLMNGVFQLLSNDKGTEVRVKMPIEN